METSDYIALADALFTGLFAFLLWRTTKRIGKKQNELQENQTKLQEYHYKLELNKAYRNLYICLKDTQQICKEYFYYLERGIMAIVDKREKQYFQSFYDRIEAVYKEIKIHQVDMELQLTEYPTLTHDLDDLYLSMCSIQLDIKSIQIPLTLIDNKDFWQKEMLNKMIQLINVNIPNYYVNVNSDINKLSTNDYANIANETRKIMLAYSWQLEYFFEKSDDEIIKHISDVLSCLTDNTSICSWCKHLVEAKKRIFTKNKALDLVKEKCMLK